MAIEPVEHRIREVKKRHEAALLATPGVVGVGISEIRDGYGRRHLCIRIYVEMRDEAILRGLPKEIEGFATDIKAVGRSRLL